VTSEEKVKIKTCVLDNSKHIGRVDEIPDTVETHKWHIKIFHRLIIIAVLNTMIIYKNIGNQIHQVSFKSAAGIQLVC
jgi:hypothetical protein